MKIKTASFRFRLKCYLTHLFKSSNKKSVKVVLFAQGRSGSTLLESLIASTGHFEANGEILVKSGAQVTYPYWYISGLSKRSRKKNFIFHLKIYHLTKDRQHPVDPKNYLQKLYNDGWKIIYLVRENKLNQALSNIIRSKRGKARKFDSKEESYNLTVNLNTIENAIKGRLEYEKQEREVLKGLKYLEISYENNLENSEDHKKTIDSILDFLGLERKNASTKLKKINRKHASEILNNFDEVVEMLRKNDWTHFEK